MSDVTKLADAVIAETQPHDHAWRKVPRSTPDPLLLVGEYRCDLCSATWSM